MNDSFWIMIEAIATAIAALFAIIGTRIAWRSLKKDVSGQQSQIDALSKQTEAIRDSTKVDSQILSKLTDHFARDAEISELTNEKYKLDIRPYFEFDGSQSDDSGNYVIKFRNAGGDLAVFKEVSIINSTPYKVVNVKKLDSKEIINKSELIYILLLRNTSTGWNQIQCKIELKFTDKTEKNSYKQIINFINANISIDRVQDNRT